MNRYTRRVSSPSRVAAPLSPIGAAASTERASLLVLGMAAFMVQADARVIDPLLHVVATDFHTTPPNAAIVISAYALPYGLFQLFYGPLGDRIGKLRSEEHTSELQSLRHLVCRLLLEKKKQ